MRIRSIHLPPCKWQLTQAPPISLTAEEVHLYTNSNCQTIVDLSLEGDQWIFFCLDGDQAQTYNLNSGSTVTVQFDGYSPNLFGSSGTIDLEQLNMAAGTVKGTFDFLVMDPVSLDQLEFTNGAFYIEKDE